MNELLKIALGSVLGVQILDVHEVQEEQAKGNLTSNVNFRNYSEIIHGIQSNRKSENVSMTSEIMDIFNGFSIVGDENINNNNNGDLVQSNLVNINIKMVSNDEIQSLMVNLEEMKVESLKSKIQQIFNINSEIYLICGGKQLENGKTLKEHEIEADTTLFIVPKAIKVQLNEVLDPDHDYNFVYINPLNDRGQHFRGGKEYIRPCGFIRFALSVFNRFPPNNKWLRTDNTSWPVSYHPSLCPSDQSELRELTGHSNDSNILVTSQDINSIISLCRRFQFKGETYIIAFQNRINPENLVEAYTPVGTFYLSPNSDSIRPYAICIKKL